MFYDYIEATKALDKLDGGILKEVDSIGFSGLEKLPIRCFRLGSGKNNVVVTGAQHANELISTTFIIKLMEYIKNNNISFDDLSIYFIPILNPEGYIVSTSAIKAKIARDENTDKFIKYCFSYYNNYRYDEVNKTFRHQRMFNDIDHTSISKDYNILRDSVEDILCNHPKGSIIDWASNGRGIDLNSNSVNKVVEEGQFNRKNAYSNIRLDIPSPIGYPGDNKSASFKCENEVQALKDFLDKLDKDGNLLGYLNYHSTGGIIYQRPESDDNLFLIAYNYLLSRFYQEKTIKNDSTYGIVNGYQNKIVSVNDELRVLHKGNLLIELSPMMGNPIGVFGDLNNYTTTINSNIDSFIYTMNNLTKIHSLTNDIVKKKKEDELITHVVDKEYEESIKL